MVLGDWLEERLNLKRLRTQRAVLEADVESKRQELLSLLREEFRNQTTEQIRRQAGNRAYSRALREALRELLSERLREEVR